MPKPCACSPVADQGVAVRIHPLKAVRPVPERAADVASPPYDVVSRDEAARLVRDKPSSFLRVVRSDADLPDDVDPYEAGVIKKHETTRPDKEDDRTRHILALEAHAEPVLLAYRGRPEIDR